MPNQPFRLLAVLAQRPGELVSREELQQQLWENTFIDFDHALNKAVNRVREALNDNADNPQFIETVPRRGYRFIAQVVSQPQGGTSQPEKEPLPARSSRPVRMLAAALIVVTVCAILAAALFLRPASRSLKITETSQLTSDGHFKDGEIVTDGVRLFFNEVVSGHFVTASVPVSGGQVVYIKTPFEDTSIAGISADKVQLLVGKGQVIEDHPLWLIPATGGTPRRLADVVGHSASWSPDGTRLAYAKAGDLYMALGDGTNPVLLVPHNADADVWIWVPRWSPDGTRLRFTRFEMDTRASTLWEVDVKGGPPHQLFANSSQYPMQCCGEWTHDGNYFLFNSWNSIESGEPAPAANLWGMGQSRGIFSRKMEKPFQMTAGPLRFFADVLDPHRDVIYTTSTRKQGQLELYDAKTKRAAPYLSGISADNLTFSRDGSWVAYVTYPQGELWRSRTDGSEALQLTTSGSIAAMPGWSPDGSRIAFSEKTMGQPWRLYVVQANGGTPSVVSGTEYAFGASWAPDGSALVYGDGSFSRPDILKTINLKTKQIAVVPGSEGFNLPQWSPDGRSILAADGKRLVLFSCKTRQWSSWSSADSPFHPLWSRDGKAAYFVAGTDHRGVYRVGLGEHSPRKVLDLDEINFANPDSMWFSLTPQDDPVLLQDVGGGFEIYAQHWSVD